MKEDRQLYLAKLESSGLTEADGRELGLECLASTQTSALHPSFKPLPALKLPYWDPRKPSQLLTAHPRWPGFYRLRYLKEAQDFAQQAKGKALRYVQPPDSGVCAYFPRFKDVDWGQILANADQSLLITEGELKAAKATKEGFLTIGLGGVYNFRSAKQFVSFLPELEAVNWVKRQVFMVFDSDVVTNPNVSEALNKLAHELYERGAVPYVMMLPELEKGQKTGLDDYLVAESSDALEALIEAESQPLSLTGPMWRLNEQVTYIMHPSMVVRDSNLEKMSVTAFKDSFGNIPAHEAVMKNGQIVLEPVSAPAAWMKWPLRDTAAKLTYAPGRPRRDCDQYNFWPGWACEPKKGDVSPFLSLVRHLFKGSPKEDLEWFLRWLAFPIQHPGTKLATAVMLFGIRQGTGKTLIGYTMEKIYGQNFTSIKQADLTSTFNAWADCRQFILADDITGSNNRQDADVLKKMITQKDVWINQKNIPQFSVPDCANFLFTSNQPDALFLEDDDRRFFVHEVKASPLSEEFYADYDLWLSSSRAGPAIFHYFQTLDLGDFNPLGRARNTAAKDRMIADTRSDLGSWVRQLRESPDAVLRVGQVPMESDLYTNAQLLDLYDPNASKRVTANGLGRELKRAGFFQVLDGAHLRGPDGKVDRYYAVRNTDRWLEASRLDVERHLQPREPKRRKF